jgi:chromosome segregation ATPase
MASSTYHQSLSNILTKNNRTSDDLQQLIDQWHNDLLENEKRLVQYAHKLDLEEQILSKTTESFIQAQDVLNELEINYEEFNLFVQNFKTMNDELEANLEKFNNDSQTLLPAMIAKVETEQERASTYELMDSVDSHLQKLVSRIAQIHKSVQTDMGKSIITTADELQTCFHDIHQLQDTIKQLKIEQE